MNNERIASTETGFLSQRLFTSFRRITGIQWALAVLVLAFILGCALRLPLLPHQSYDYQHFLKPWYDILSATGGFAGLAHNFSDYTPPYLAFLAGAATYSLPPLISIKLLSVFFDILLAGCAGYLVWSVSRKPVLSALAASTVFLSPTVVLNSAAWGQSDAIYAALCLGALIALLRKSPTIAVALFTAALSVKLQAIFIAPVFVVLLVRGNIRLRDLWPAPLVYLLSILPALTAGRPLADVFGIYLVQMSEYPWITYFAPTVYQFFGTNAPMALGYVGIALILAGTVFLCIYLRRLHGPLEPRTFLILALFSALAVPFFLPRMHERYFYVAETLSIVYAFLRPRRWFLPVILIGISTLNYLFLLFQIRQSAKSLWVYLWTPEAVFFAGAVAVVAVDFFTAMRATERGSPHKLKGTDGVPNGRNRAHSPREA